MTPPTPRRAATRPVVAGPVITDRALTRATLARQHLLRRSSMSAEAMIEHLVGLQAQAPYPPYTGLWTRLESFAHGDLAELLTERRAVRILLQRGTVHLVTARDCLALRPLLQPLLDRLYLRARVLAEGADPALVAPLTHELLADGPLTPAQLGAALAERLPPGRPAALVDIARGRVPLVQVPPRAVWGVGGVTRYATVESWLDVEAHGLAASDGSAGDGRPASDRPAALAELVRRHLRAFGPASVADVQAWSGLTRLREVTDALPDLVRCRAEDGRPLLDVPGAPLPDPDEPAPVRFLPAFDNALLAHADRSRIIADEVRGRVFGVGGNGIIEPTVLVDGRVAGSWRCDDGVMTVTAFRALDAATVDELHAEGLRLARFLAPAGALLDVRLV